MKKLSQLFKPEDFIAADNPTRELLSPQDRMLAEAMASFAAEIANAKLEAWLKEQPLVYGHKHNDPEYDENAVFCMEIDEDCTHRARLCCIEKIRGER